MAWDNDLTGEAGQASAEAGAVKARLPEGVELAPEDRDAAKPGPYKILRKDRWEREVLLQKRLPLKAIVRPFRQGDAEKIERYVKHGLSKEDIRLRYGYSPERSALWAERRKEYNPLDLDKHMVFVVELEQYRGELGGICHGYVHGASGGCEVAYSRRTAFADCGIGTLVMDTLLEWALQNPKISFLEAQTLKENARMNGLFERRGFKRSAIADDPSAWQWKLKIK